MADTVRAVSIELAIVGTSILVSSITRVGLVAEVARFVLTISAVISSVTYFGDINAVLSVLVAVKLRLEVAHFLLVGTVFLITFVRAVKGTITLFGA